METTTTLSPNLHTFYQKVLLETAEKKLRFRQFADEKVHPKGNGKDYYALRYGHMTTNTTPLSEGITPSENTIDTNRYTVTIQQYGDYVSVADFLQMTAIDPVIKSLSKEAGYAAAKSMDEIIRDHLIANATNNIQYVGSTATTDNTVASTDLFTAQDALKPVRLLKGTDAPTFDDGNYVWIIHPYIEMDILGDTSAGGFIELNKYVAGMAEKPFRGEVGKAYGARIVSTSNISSVANASSPAVNVYRTFMLAKNAYIMTRFDKDAIRLIVKNNTEGGPTNPLELRSTVGWKMHFGVKYVGGSFTNHNEASPDLAIQLRGAATDS